MLQMPEHGWLEPIPPCREDRQVDELRYHGRLVTMFPWVVVSGRACACLIYCPPRPSRPCTHNVCLKTITSLQLDALGVHTADHI